MSKVLVIMPAYNEEESIGAFLDKLKPVLPHDYHLLVINDGSRDRTEETARSRGVEVITQIFNLGYGSALQLGYKYAVRNGYEYVMQLDSDGQHDAENILKMEKIIEGENPPDIVIGSRFLEGSRTFRIPFLKKMVVRLFQFIIKRTSGQQITDPTSGLQCLNQKAFTYYAGYTNFDHQYPDINMIIQMCVKGYRIEEFPAIMHRRECGTSMHSGLWKPFVYMILMMISTINVFIREKWELRKKGK